MKKEITGKITEARNFLSRQVEKRPFVCLIIAVALIWATWQFVGGFVGSIRHAITGASVAGTEQGARDEQTAAQGEIKTAGDASVERRVEDGTREQVINPQIERTARTVAEARERTNKAVGNYEATQTNNRRSNLDDDLLRRRNCADLAGLYPGERFAGCQ